MLTSSAYFATLVLCHISSLAVAVRRSKQDVQPSLKLEADASLLELEAKHGFSWLQYASPEICADQEFVSVAVSQNGRQLRFASKGLRAAMDIVLAAVKNDWKALKYASDELQDLEDIVQIALDQNGEALRYASPRLQAKKDFVFAAVKANPDAIEYVDRAAFEGSLDLMRAALHDSPELQRELDMAKELISRNAFWFAYLSDKLQDIDELAFAAVAQNGRMLQYASPRLKADRKLTDEVYESLGTKEFWYELGADRDIAFAMIKDNGRLLEHASTALKRDKDLVLAAVRSDGSALSFASDELKRDREVILLAKQGDNSDAASLRLDAMSFFDTFGDDKEVLTAVLKDDGVFVKLAPIALRADPEIMGLALHATGTSLMYAAESIRSDRIMVLAAAERVLKESQEYAKRTEQQRRDLLRVHAPEADYFKASAEDSDDQTPEEWEASNDEYTDHKLSQDERWLKVMKQELDAFQAFKFYENFTDDRDIMLLAVRLHGPALQDASATVKGDPEVVREACRESGQVLQFASLEVKANATIVSECAQEDWGALLYASEAVMSDTAVIKAAEEGCRRSTASRKKYFHDGLECLLDGPIVTFRSARGFVLAAASLDGYVLEKAADELKDDKEIVLAAQRSINTAFKFASDRLKGDREVVEPALQVDPLALEFTSDRIKAQKDVVLAVVSRNGRALQFASKQLAADREVARAALTQNALSLEFVSEELKDDRLIVLSAIEKKGSALQFASERLRAQREVVLPAILQDGRALAYAASAFRNDRTFKPSGNVRRKTQRLWRRGGRSR